MREWAKANGGPIGLLVLGALAAFPNRIVGIALIGGGSVWYLLAHDRVRSWMPVRWTGFGNKPPINFSQTYFADQTIRIAELFPPGSAVVKGKTFERCRFIGPAVVAFLGGSHVISPGFDVGGLTPDALLWEMTEDRWVLGGVAFSDCVLRGCSFEACGIAATKDQIEHIRSEFRFDP
jgi:hypothetical protein